MLSPEIKTIRSLLASGQTETALQQLMQVAEAFDKSTYNAAILLRASWENQEQAAINGSITFEEAGEQRSLIVQGALDLLTDMESDGAVSRQLGEDLNAGLWNERTAALMQMIDNDRINVRGSSILAEEGASVIVGEGNTINKRTYNALGIRQFGILFTVLLLLGGGGFAVYKLLNRGQDQAYASLSDIKKELGILADLNRNLGEKLEKDRPEIEALLEKAAQAMKKNEYGTAIRYWEKVAETAPAATIYQNIAVAYEQMGEDDNAQENLQKAKAINPDIAIRKPAAALKGKRINLLAQENGGKMLAASTDLAKVLTDGSLQDQAVSGGFFAVYSFLDGKAARFDQFEVYIPNAMGKQQLELFYGNDSPTGNFTSTGIFEPFDGYLSDAPFQKFNFPPVTAKYFKVKKDGYVLSYEIRLMGTLE